MQALASFCEQLFEDGRIILRDPPEEAGSSQAVQVLQRAYASHRLNVAGPLLDFDPEAALAAAMLLWKACWFLLRHDQPAEEMERRLRMTVKPRTPAQHLSADLVLRYLPQVHRRAHALEPADRLPALLATELRHWPLSGVLSDVEEGPLTGLDFDGHPGLLLLYAERLASNVKPAWMPEGPARDYVELVWRELGKDPATLPTREPCP